MNKTLIVILIIFGIILFFNRKKVKENMTENKKDTIGCKYPNSLNNSRGNKDCYIDENGKEQCKCYFNAINDSDLGINTLKPILKNKLSKKQLDLGNNTKFFNYENLQIVKPSYKNNEENDKTISRPNFTRKDVFWRPKTHFPMDFWCADGHEA